MNKLKVKKESFFEITPDFAGRVIGMSHWVKFCSALKEAFRAIEGFHVDVREVQRGSLIKVYFPEKREEFTKGVILSVAAAWKIDKIEFVK